MRLPGVFFETDKAFLLPGGLRGMRGLGVLYAARPNMAMVVTGHTDRVGAADYNVGLSKERADAVACYLRDDVDGWMKWYGVRSHSQTWGVREDQYMLSAVVDPQTSAPLYGDSIDGQAGPATQASIRRLQQSRGLPSTGFANQDTRRALVTAYMELDGTSAPATVSIALLGCGEHHNEVPTAEHVPEQANRRVEIFCFGDGQVEPPVPSHCPNVGCPYLQWKQQNPDIIDLGLALGTLAVKVVAGGRSNPVAGASVRLAWAGAIALTGVTDHAGAARFEDLLPGPYEVSATKDGLGSDSETLVVTPGGTSNQPASHFLRTSTTSPAAMSPGDNSVTLALGGGGGGDDITIRVVAEHPPELEDRVKEGIAREGRRAWERLHATPRWQTATNPVSQERPLDERGELVITPADALADHGVLEAVGRRSHHIAPLLYTLREPGDPTVILDEPPITRGETRDVAISARARFSIWTFGTPLMKTLDSLDTVQLDLMKKARLDDLTFNYTMAPKESNWKVKADGTVEVTGVGVTFTTRFGPGGTTGRSPEADKRREAYLKMVVEELHARGMQVILGYTIGTDGEDETPSTRKFNREFAAWLLAMTDDQLGQHALEIDAFRDRFDADGVGFDFELDDIGYEHRDNLQRLIRYTALAVQRSNGVVSYATAPFVEDGKATAIGPLGNNFRGLSIQPFALAKTAKNLIARPMCFAKKAFPMYAAERSIDFALRPESAGGAGLDPSQIQFAIWADALGDPDQYGPERTTELCSKVLRPQRMGMMVYRMRQHAAGAAAILQKCTDWERALNPGEIEPGHTGQPVQVPLWLDLGPEPNTESESDSTTRRLNPRAIRRVANRIRRPPNRRRRRG